MNKYFLAIALFLSILAVNADSWDDFSNVDRMWDGQKTITNKEFEEVMDVLEDKKQEKEKKQKKKWFKKISGGGTSLHNELNHENEIEELQSLKPKDEGMLINAPMVLYINGNPLEKGFYKVIATREQDGKIYISFYQSQFFKGKIEAVETDNDFGEEELDFAKVLPYNESFVKIIFGSIDFNAYAFVPYTE